MSADDYVKRIGGFPVTGKEVQLDPYLKAKVTSIGEKDVTLSILATDGAQFSEPYGTVTAAVNAEGVTLKLAPIMEAAFQAGDRQGVITASDNKSFTIDFNNPLAGKTILLGLEVVKVTRAAALNTKPIDWIEEHDAGLARAKKEGKPVFLLLYADWCHFCKRLFAETMPDPRIERLKDKFVWVKVNSDKAKQYKQLYGQNGFPMIVLLKSDGTVIKKIDGYRDARGLKTELDGVI
jgi:thiol-disulfide isomerase/thioredoxin